MSQPPTSLQALRERIDALDQQIQELLNERARCALTVAEVKQASGQAEQKIAFYRPEREAQILRRVMQRNRGPLSDVAVARLFREVISACMALEQTLTVAYSYAGTADSGIVVQTAALKHFGQAVQTRACQGEAEVLQTVLSGAADFGVLTPEGLLSSGLQPFIEGELRVCGETQAGRHPVSRFLVIGRLDIDPSGEDKTVLLLGAQHQPGGLMKLLAPLAQHQVNILRIDSVDKSLGASRASDEGINNERFFVELAGHYRDRPIAQALAELQTATPLCKVLGSYPVKVL